MKNLSEGLLIKGYNGFYYVASEGTLWTCFLRGRFRIKKQVFLPGDRVQFTKLEYPKGVIENVCDRANRLVRPAVANVEKVLITFALTNPSPDLILLDRILIQAMHENIHAIICFNKADLYCGDSEESVAEVYRRAGFEVYCASAETGEGMDKIKNALKNSVTVLAGPSGVGKSSIINVLAPNLKLETGCLSKKTERGRHTTRKVELLSIDEETYIADTPGFSSIYLPNDLMKEDLPAFYPEFSGAAAYCPFKSCLHLNERECEVKNDVENGLIDRGRYERYCLFLNELKEREKKY